MHFVPRRWHRESRLPTAARETERPVGRSDSASLALADYDGSERLISVDLKAQPPEGEAPRAMESAAGLGAGDPEAALHAAIAAADDRYEREMTAVEREARLEAAHWGVKGLPRHDVMDRATRFQPEQVIEGQCLAASHRWCAAVGRAVGEAVDRAAGSAAQEVARLRAATQQLHAASADARLAEEAARHDATRAPLRADTGGTGRALRGLLGGRIGIAALTVLLVAVEFVANRPVLELLLPADGALVAIAERQAMALAGEGWLAGVLLMLGKTSLSVEATVATVAVVVLLVLCAKTAGGLLRELLGPEPATYEMTGASARARRRQLRLAAGVAVTGVALTLLFLHGARERLPASVHRRLATAEAELAAAERQATDGAGTLARLSADRERVRAARRSVEQRRADAAYADAVHAINGPILVLNAALAVGSLILGFAAVGPGRDGETTEEAGATTRILHEARQRVAERLLEGRRADAEARRHLAAARRMLSMATSASPEAHRERARLVIALFRGENARVRSMDPEHIGAFALASLDESAWPTGIAVENPPVLAELETTLHELARELAIGSAHMHPSPTTLRPPDTTARQHVPTDTSHLEAA